MAKALISIDYTEDFVADHGKLTAGAPAQAISKAIDQVTRLAFDRGDYVFFTIDAHEEKDTFHPESKLFPPHNIIGTSGRNLYGPLADLDGNKRQVTASVVADHIGITRSVIVNALRKLESAGIIESRSLAMKGTYLKVLIDDIFEEVKKRDY